MGKGIGRKVSEKSERRWAEDMERLALIRKMTCRKLGNKAEKNGHGYTEPTMGERARKEVKKTIMKEKKN